MDSLNQPPGCLHKSPGLGDDLRWDERETIGFMLAYNDEAIHTAAFAM